MSAWGTVSIPAASAIDMTRCSLSGRHVYSDDAGFKMYPAGKPTRVSLELPFFFESE